MNSLGLFCSALAIAIPTIARANDMTFESGSSGSTDGSGWIYASGEIKQDTPVKFRAFLDANSKVSLNTVMFNSPGGDLSAGLELGRIIRQHKLDTTVNISVPIEGTLMQTTKTGGICASACSYAFLGGVKRATEDKTVGVHQFFFPDDRDNPNQIKYTGADLSNEQKIVAAVLQYVVEMGVDARVVVSASTTNPTDVHWLTTEEMAEFNITRDPLAFSPWALEVYKGRVISASKTGDKSRTATIYCGTKSKSLTLFINEDIGSPMDDEGITSLKAEGANLFGEDIQSDDVVVKSSGNSLFLTLKVPSHFDATAEQQSYGLGSTGPLRIWYDEKLPYENFNDYARVVMRFCN